MLCHRGTLKNIMLNFKKADTRDYILYDSFIWIVQKIFRDRKEINSHLGLEMGTGINCK